jgi:Lar family restriction alleviation protein
MIRGEKIKSLDWCPFCGCKEVNLIEDDHEMGTLFYITCNHCGARGGSFIGEDDTADDAIHDWNQKELRSRTLCERITKLLIQYQYDVSTLVGRYK